jgi:anti-sigma factor RsiW
VRATCQEVAALVTRYLDGALGARRRARLDTHLRACDGCAGYVEQLRAAIRVADRLAPGAIPDATMSRLVAAFRSWPRR